MADYEVDQSVYDEPSANVETESVVDNTQKEAEVANGDQTGQQSSSSESKPSQPAWNGKEWAIKFRDKEIVPESREKLINLAQLGYSYDKRAGDLKKREEEIAKLNEQHKQYAQIAESFQKNPEFKKQILQMYYQALNGGGQNNAGAIQESAQGEGAVSSQQNNIPPEYFQKIDTLTQKLSMYENQSADAALNREIEDMTAKYKVDWNTPNEDGKTFLDEVLDEAHKMGGVPLDVAFKNLYYEKAIENAKAEALAAQSNKVKVGAVVQGNSRPISAKPKAFNSRSMSYDDIAKSVISGAIA